MEDALAGVFGDVQGQGAVGAKQADEIDVDAGDVGEGVGGDLGDGGGGEGEVGLLAEADGVVGGLEGRADLGASRGWRTR